MSPQRIRYTETVSGYKYFCHACGSSGAKNFGATFRLGQPKAVSHPIAGKILGRGPMSGEPAEATTSGKKRRDPSAGSSRRSITPGWQTGSYSEMRSEEFSNSAKSGYNKGTLRGDIWLLKTHRRPGANARKACAIDPRTQK